MTITYTFKEQILPETEGYPEGVVEGAGTPYPYGGGAYESHQFSWYFDEDGLTVDVDAYMPEASFGFGGVVIPPSVMTEYLGIDDINQLADLSFFYPLDSAGNPLTSWSSYAPGQWVDAKGDPIGWSEGIIYWQYQFGDSRLVRYNYISRDGVELLDCSVYKASPFSNGQAQIRIGTSVFTINKEGQVLISIDGRDAWISINELKG